MTRHGVIARNFDLGGFEVLLIYVVATYVLDSSGSKVVFLTRGEGKERFVLLPGFLSNVSPKKTE